MAPTQTIEIKDLPPELRGQARPEAVENWVAALEREVALALDRGEKGVMDGFTRQFEKALITKALAYTHGRRIEAANLLGLGRNTLTRKIRELDLESGEPGEGGD